MKFQRNEFCGGKVLGAKAGTFLAHVRGHWLLGHPVMVIHVNYCYSVVETDKWQMGAPPYHYRLGFGISSDFSIGAIFLSREFSFSHFNLKYHLLWFLKSSFLQVFDLQR